MQHMLQRLSVDPVGLTTLRYIGLLGSYRQSRLNGTTESGFSRYQKLEGFSSLPDISRSLLDDLKPHITCMRGVVQCALNELHTNA